MSRKKIILSDYVGQIVSSLPRGVLLTTKANGKVNAMTIGWGTLGTNWGRPIFAAYIREGRYTRELLDKNPEFTVNIPVNNDYDRKIIAICGSKSGRNTDKISLAGLTLSEPEIISVPGVKQLPLTLECRVIYRQLQEISLLRDENLCKALYPQDVDGSAVGANRDAHVSYYGEILASYIIE